MTEARPQQRLSSLPPLRALRLEELRRLRKIVYDEAGIFLPDSKRALVEARLGKRIRELGLSSYDEYCTLLSSSGQGRERELVLMLDRITTNETCFFREDKHFELLERTVLPRWAALGNAGARPRRVRAWSAACSTGEEPYSLAMCLLSALPSERGWSVEVLGSDISTRVLDRARGATWPMDRAKEIPDRHLKRFMLRGFGAHEGELRCGPELRSAVQLARINLNSPPYAGMGQLDLIFCRNVLIYFDAESRARVIDALIDRLSPTGILFVGHSEGLHSVTRRVNLIAPSVYVRADAGRDAVAYDAVEST
jgi:chemotaxis protein methyltransferase CheR